MSRSFVCNALSGLFSGFHVGFTSAGTIYSCELCLYRKSSGVSNALGFQGERLNIPMSSGQITKSCYLMIHQCHIRIDIRDPKSQFYMLEKDEIEKVSYLRFLQNVFFFLIHYIHGSSWQCKAWPIHKFFQIIFCF